MIWEFWKYEKYHGKKSTAFDIVFHGEGRSWVFTNNPSKQRKAHCQGCGTIIPREVPRLKLNASYYFGAGYYCLSCGKKELQKKKANLEYTNSSIEEEIENLKGLVKITEEVMNDPDEFYKKKMALAKMLRVMEPEKRGY